MNKKLRPCDCKDVATAKLLNEQGIGFNTDSITVEPGVVILKMGHTEIKIPMGRFKQFAEWYLEEQDIENKKTMKEETPTKKIDLEAINGYEIIDFLNTINDDVYMSQGSFVFEQQEVEDDEYKLTFTASFNNWDVKQPIPGNYLRIDKNGLVHFLLKEPFDVDDSADILEETLLSWLQTHTFDSSLEEKFDSIMRDVYETLPGIGLGNKKDMQEVIDLLIKAKTYMK